MEVVLFASDEAASLWRYIASSIDRLVAIASESGDGVARWKPPAENSNAISGLALHTLANARENILGVVCGEDVGRDRGAEFGAVPAEQIAATWEALRADLASALAGISQERMGAPVEHPRRGRIPAREVLIVVARHAAEHLGQAELTRDLAMGDLFGHS